MSKSNPNDPFYLFGEWFAEAKLKEVNDPSAMALATATPEGRPSVRMVLLKDWSERGFVFYTNLKSRKSAELFANPHAALNFHWKSIRKQIRVEGPVIAVTDEEADAYFASRPRDSQIGAWASEQSHPLESRAKFLARITKVTSQYALGSVPRPPHWSGFCIVPEQIEFWEDKPFRLHERRLFTRQPEGWVWTLLYP